ncbi:MAG: glycosyltransferase [Firmicutes bacterium]|jgi:cellulose synthase/poly-beta-1,6-N-acetylglucosamine synthase-like glycosyltransferase|nr:glycosyltransferase [Bacillota bacterium]
MLWAGNDLSRYALILLAVYGLLALSGAVRRAVLRRHQSQEEKPFVSILVIARDDEYRIEGVLRWLLSLNYLDHLGRPNYELVAVSAGSNDQTPAIVERLARENVLLKALAVAKGEPAYEQGLALCQGEVVCLLDLGKQALREPGRAVTRILNEGAVL